MKRPQKLAVMLVPTPPYEICGLVTRPGTTYEMEASGDAQKWSVIGGTDIAGDGSRRGFNLNNPGTVQRYYRFKAKSF